MNAVSQALAVFSRHPHRRRPYEAAKPEAVEVHAPPGIPTAEPGQPTLELEVPRELKSSARDRPAAGSHHR